MVCVDMLCYLNQLSNDQYLANEFKLLSID